jgi:hypothetical protein
MIKLQPEKNYFSIHKKTTNAALQLLHNGSYAETDEQPCDAAVGRWDGIHLLADTDRQESHDRLALAETRPKGATAALEVLQDR